MLRIGAVAFMSFNSFIPIKKIDAKMLQISKDSQNVLNVKIEGENLTCAFKPMKCFPLTDPEHYLGFFKKTAEGIVEEEIVLIDDFNKLDTNSRSLIEQELNKEYPLTKIKKIYSIEQTKNTSKWRVDTDKGEKVFEVEHQNEIYMVQPSLAVIEDVEKNTFLVDPSRLDPKSLSLLEIYR